MLSHFSCVWFFATLCSSAGSSVCGILQARKLERVAISFSKESSLARDRTPVSCTGKQILYHWTTREASGSLLKKTINVYAAGIHLLRKNKVPCNPQILCLRTRETETKQRAVTLWTAASSAYSDEQGHLLSVTVPKEAQSPGQSGQGSFTRLKKTTSMCFHFQVSAIIIIPYDQHGLPW